MATDLGASKTAKAAAKNDAFVNAQLARAEKRIRALDVGAALLGFAALLCVFAAALSLADRAWSLPPWARQLGLVGFLLVGGAYLYFTLARPLLYRVNPYYAAQRVERTMPGAKNSVVNWLDLQQQKLPPAIRAAVGQKAAKDLSKADVDGAFSGRRLAWVGAAAGACAAGLIACLLWIGGDSFYHLQRVFAPFSFGSPAPTTITITRPERGDETVTVKQPVFIAARVEGKLPDPKGPDAVKLLYRYEENGPYLERLMRHDGGEFTATVSANDVRDGFWYKVAAGAVETPEYRVTVRATPLLTKVQATYHFRPYVARADEEHFARRPFKLEALRGTEVTLLVDTNRPVKQAYLVLEGKDRPERLPAEIVGEDAKGFRVKHVIDRTTRYRLEYTTPDNESYADPNYQELVAVPDKPPEVTITAPGRDVQMPCNGVLQVEGAAADDVGVKSVTLKLRVTNGPELKAKEYRSDRELRLPSGGYATSLAYKDFVDLKTVQTPDSKPFALAAGMELEYWLEASDACDYPQPNVAESKHYRAQLLDAEKDSEKQQSERDQAKQEQQQHEKKQNDALKKEEQARQENEQRQKEEARQEKEALNNKPESGKQEPKEGSQPKQPEGDPGASADPAQKKRDEETQKQADALKRAMEEEQRRQDEAKHHASAKPDPKQEPAKPGENKEFGPKPDTPPSAPKPEQKADPQQPPPAEKKQPPPQTEKRASAQEKDEGKTSDQEHPRSASKNGGQPTNPDNPMPPPAADKAEDKGAGREDRGDQAKSKPGGSPMSSESKPEPKPTDDAKNAVAKDDKPADGGIPPKADPAGAKPEDVANEARGLKSESVPERKDAAKQLDKIAQQAKDEKAREAAKRALEDAGLKPPSEAEAKKPPETKDAQGDAAKAKDDANQKPADKGTAKGSDKDGKEVPKAEDKNLGTPVVDEKTPEPDDPAQKKELQQKREAFLKKLEEQQRRQGNFDAKKWQEFLRRNGDKINPPEIGKEKERPPFVPEENLLKSDDPPPVTKENPPRDDKATTLQLQKFMDAIDKKTLQKAGITEEQWREFLKRYADLAKREDAAAQEAPAAPQNKGPLVGTGGTRTNPGAKADPNAPGGTGRTPPPPAYRDAWRQFTRDLSTPDEKK